MGPEVVPERSRPLVHMPRPEETSPERMEQHRLEFRILGPLRVQLNGTSVPLGGPKQRALLALLLLSANRVVSRERLIGELFAEQGLNSANHALENHVSRLRRVLGAATPDEPRLAARSGGYLLRVEPGELDLERFEQRRSSGQRASSWKGIIPIDEVSPPRLHVETVAPDVREPWILRTDSTSFSLAHVTSLSLEDAYV